MELVPRNNESARIEIRVSKKDKELFESASAIRGFKSFSEFARVTITKEAHAILAENNKIISTQRDKDIFFAALMGKEEKPNKALLSAIEDFRNTKKTK